jgi:hypothetical protein
MDKTISLGTVIAIGIQTLAIVATAIGWASSIDQRLGALESQKATDARLVSLEKDQQFLTLAQTENRADLREIKLDLKEVLILAHGGDINGSKRKAE